MSDSFNLERFVAAQRADYATALAELRRGQKQSHWIWYVFPQLAGLGFSETSRFYGVGSLEEARAYLEHPTLGPRLGECTSAACAHRGRTARQIFAGDDVKFRSSMTLFAAAGPGERAFADALGQFFDGIGDPATLAILAGGS